ncbi:MAG: hypothetical protein ABL974_05460, partial [Prosthecobacter sp.]
MKQVSSFNEIAWSIICAAFQPVARTAKWSMPIMSFEFAALSGDAAREAADKAVVWRKWRRFMGGTGEAFYFGQQK